MVRVVIAIFACLTFLPSLSAAALLAGSCGFHLQKKVTLLPENLVVQAELYNGFGLAPRDRQKYDLFKLARLLEDAGYLPAGEMYKLPADLNKLAPFKLAEVLNVENKFLLPKHVEELREKSPYFKFVDHGDGRIDLMRQNEKGEFEFVLQMDVGPFRAYSLYNVTAQALPLHQREYLAYFFEEGVHSAHAVNVFYVSPGAVERHIPIVSALFPKYEELHVAQSLRRFFIRTDLYQRHLGETRPLIRIKNDRR